MNQQHLFIGLMSGTSADGVDAVLADFSGKPTVLHHFEQPLPSTLKQKILNLCLPGPDEISRLGELDREIGILFAQTANQLLQHCQLSAADITAIGSHGQTVRHAPPGSCSLPYSLQIGDPNTIAENTGITTVADFRRRDVAAGGQGAPLVPAFHEAVFLHPAKRRVIVNIGGMANITILEANTDTLGFDTGPGNVLMDGWIFRYHQQNHDKDGQWAAGGTPSTMLLDRLLAHPFLSQPAPKSTGRETFNLDWLDQQLQAAPALTQLSPQDVQATLLEFTAQTISTAISGTITNPSAETDVFVCGGGVKNLSLMTRLQQLLPTSRVASTIEMGIEPQSIEALAFAWLAHQTLNQQSGNLPAVTGARGRRILGGIFQA